MTFVSRVRSTVRASAEGGEDAGDPEFAEHGIGEVPHYKPANNPPDLDEDELDKEGARAILELTSSLYASKFVGVNSSFCSIFGFDRSDLASATFKILLGPLTNTKHLQEVWSEVRKGLDKSISCSLYNKTGEMLALKMEVFLRRSEHHEHQAVSVLRFSLARQCSPPPIACDPAAKRLVALRRLRTTNGTNQPLVRISSELEMERVLRRLEGIMPPTEMDRLRKALENLVPKAKLDAAEAEIARLKKQLLESDTNTEFQRLRRQLDDMVPKEAVHSLHEENERLSRLMEDMVPHLDLERAHGHLHEAQEEINRLKKALEEMEKNSSINISTSGRSSTTTCLGSPLSFPLPSPPSPPSLQRMNSEVSRAIAGRASSALREIFPKQIADAIMEGRTLQPINKECVSVFFSDVVGFTAISSTLPAAKVSDLLNRLFAKFDALAEQHGVQKMDVIGDAYLAATNVMEDQTLDHAARIARFAIHAMAAAQETRLDEEGDDPACVRIRIGIHCGAVSASVLGSQGFKYTLLGDTVNTASRMESTSLPCEIQCSESSAGLIAQQAPDIALRAREGGVDVKGKGRMNTFWLCRGAGAGSAGAGGSSPIGVSTATGWCTRALSALRPGPAEAGGGTAGGGGVGGGGWERCSVRPASSGRVSLRASRDRVPAGLASPVYRQ